MALSGQFWNFQKLKLVRLIVLSTHPDEISLVHFYLYPVKFVPIFLVFSFAYFFVTSDVFFFEFYEIDSSFNLILYHIWFFKSLNDPFEIPIVESKFRSITIWNGQYELNCFNVLIFLRSQRSHADSQWTLWFEKFKYSKFNF